MSSHQIQMYLWVSQPVLEGALAVVLFERKLHRKVPVFFAYTVLQIAIFAIEFPVYLFTHKNPAIYFNVYWCAEALNAILAFKLIHEVFFDVFRPYPALRDLGTALFKWAALVMVLTSIVLISINPGWDDPVNRTILVVERCVRVVQCGMVIFLLAFCRNLGVSWRRLSFGIALGFGVISAPNLILTGLYFGSHIGGMTLNNIKMAAYPIAMSLWLFYALLKQAHSFHNPVLVPQRWDEALMEIQPQSEGESLIPMFETMVDRALSRVQDSRAV